MGIHTLIDGMALSASVQVDAGEGEMGLLGFGTFLAILLHKPLDTVPILILMRASRMSNRLTHVVNAAFATLCPVGVAAFFLGFERFSGHQAAIVGCVLAFSAGVFLCISLSDLLPELEFHAHDRLKLSLALLIGVAVAYAIGYIEPGHMHEGHLHGGGGHEAHIHESR
jgi:zinc and cadmium transporter